MILGLAVAFAQEPPADPPPFQLDFLPPPAQPAPVQPQPLQPMPAAPPVARVSDDPVFLAPLQSQDPSLAPEVARLNGILRSYLEQRYRISGIEAVPRWPDYDADIYMVACPPGSYSGCAMVCGDRINAQWTVGGTVSRTGTGVNVDLVFIGNASARELLQFGVGLNGTNDAALPTSADTILGKIVGGAFDAVDLRLLEGDPREQEKLARAQNDLLAESLTELEKQQGQVARTETEVTRNKLTKAELDQARTGDQVKPWETVGMSQSEYRRYRNSGKPLARWRTLRRGRMGQIIARVGIGGGVGPYNQYMDGRFAVQGPDVLEVQQYQFVSQGGSFHGDFELGFGVLPFLDVTGNYSLRQGQFKYRVNQEQFGNPVFLDDEVQRSKGSWSAGAGVSFVPLQVAPLRPALHARILYWQGTTWQKIFGGIQAFQEMKNLSMVALQAGPGVEITAGKYINIFGRGLLDVPLAGHRSETYQQGGNALQMPADTTTFKTSGLGITVQVGLVGRLSLLKPPDSKRGDTMRFEEEEDL